VLRNSGKAVTKNLAPPFPPGADTKLEKLDVPPFEPSELIAPPEPPAPIVTATEEGKPAMSVINDSA
jgi:hypothetical protein